jgi:hypothetical protein
VRPFARLSPAVLVTNVLVPQVGTYDGTRTGL